LFLAQQPLVTAVFFRIGIGVLLSSIPLFYLFTFLLGAGIQHAACTLFNATLEDSFFTEKDIP